MGIHFTYLLPAIGILTLIERTFIVRLEITKIAFLSIVALFYTVPCFNYNIFNEARAYVSERYLGVLGNSPSRSTCVRRPTNSSDLAVGNALCPVEISVFKFQSLQTQITIDTCL